MGSHYECNNYSRYDNMLNEKLHTEKVLNLFANNVIAQARRNKLSSVAQSLGYDLDVHDRSFSLEFTGNHYAEFVDQGVKGKQSSRKAPNSPFRS